MNWGLFALLEVIGVGAYSLVWGTIAWGVGDFQDEFLRYSYGLSCLLWTALAVAVGLTATG